MVNWAVVPEPSERTTGMMSLSGISTPLLSSVIAGSFHLVIWPVKIFAMVSPESRRPSYGSPRTWMLYMNAVPPATIGMYPKPRSGMPSLSPRSSLPPW